jgi:lysophospholipase L1-like esterase
LLRGGQLDRALSEDRRVDFVTIDIGANDLLGHLADDVCRGSTDDPRCAERIDSALVAYEENLEEILAEVTSAFPDATVVFLTAYNPFSFGLADAVAFEALSDEKLASLNAIAADVAGRHGVAVADGSAPMRGTVTVTTHMVDDPADIHPNALGYDVLTEALADTLGI